MAESALEELIAKQAINEVIYRYCRGLDRMDRALALSVWHDDGVADYSPLFMGTGTEFVDWVWKAHEAFVAHSHQITNVLIDVDMRSGTAASEAYVTVALRMPSNNGSAMEIVGRGRYADRWSLRNGLWAIDHRRYLHDIQSLHTVPAEDAADDTITGQRNREDGSYAVVGSMPLFQ